MVFIITEQYNKSNLMLKHIRLGKFKHRKEAN